MKEEGFLNLIKWINIIKQQVLIVLQVIKNNIPNINQAERDHTLIFQHLHKLFSQINHYYL